jgi:hypothetical protein
MQELESLSDEELNRPGPAGIVDERAAEEAGISVDELVRILDIWQKHAGAVARESSKRWKAKVASANRTVVE